MRIDITHRTLYSYSGQVIHSAQYLRLTPPGNPSQLVVNWNIAAPGQLTAWTDAFGNACHTLVQQGPTTEIAIAAAGQVETTDTMGVLPIQDGELPVEVFLRATPLTRAGAAVRDFAQPFASGLRRDRLDGLHRLMTGIGRAVAYQTGHTHVHTTADDVLTDARGVCQDLAHVFIACCRHFAIPARYVSGYLYSGDGQGLSTAGHAWAAAWVEHLGWVSFDVTNAGCGTPRHVGVAVALDYAGAAPVRGVRHGGADGEGLDVTVHVAAAQQ